MTGFWVLKDTWSGRGAYKDWYMMGQNSSVQARSTGANLNRVCKWIQIPPSSLMQTFLFYKTVKAYGEEVGLWCHLLSHHPKNSARDVAALDSVVTTCLARICKKSEGHWPENLICCVIFPSLVLYCFLGPQKSIEEAEFDTQMMNTPQSL